MARGDQAIVCEPFVLMDHTRFDAHFVAQSGHQLCVATSEVNAKGSRWYQSNGEFSEGREFSKVTVDSGNIADGVVELDVQFVHEPAARVVETGVPDGIGFRHAGEFGDDVEIDVGSRGETVGVQSCQVHFDLSPGVGRCVISTFGGVVGDIAAGEDEGSHCGGDLLDHLSRSGGMGEVSGVTTEGVAVHGAGQGAA